MEQNKTVVKVEEEETTGSMSVKGQVVPIKIKTIKTFYNDGSNDCNVIVPRLRLKSKEGEK